VHDEENTREELRLRHRYLDLRDRSGTVQITVDPELTAAMPPSKPPAPRPLPPQATCATKP